MPSLRNQQKLKSLVEKFRIMNGLIFTEYHGLTVKEISELRLRLRMLGSEYIVIKNTLGKVAARNTGIKVDNVFSGPIALVIENKDIMSSAKIVVEFAKMHTKLKIKAGFLEGKFIDASVVKQLSELPSRDVIVARMLFIMNIPIINFINVLVASIRDLMIVLNTVIAKSNQSEKLKIS
ncbi:MAG: 50S ribosomal protein L10 [Endomicrobium sp.]|jgi:large subunit ribosomal protein L10|nr:50S ribosomal protein L10 [Endomicrobium sp.]